MAGEVLMGVKIEVHIHQEHHATGNTRYGASAHAGLGKPYGRSNGKRTPKKAAVAAVKDLYNRNGER